MNEVAQAPAPVGMKNRRSRVFVVEDHELMRRSIVEALEREMDFVVCGQAQDAREALVAIESQQPDIVLTDVQLRSSSGLDLIKSLRAQLPAIPVVAITMFDVRRTERQARAAGASGFVAKQDGPEKLVATLHEALKANNNGNDDT